MHDEITKSPMYVQKSTNDHYDQPSRIYLILILIVNLCEILKRSSGKKMAGRMGGHQVTTQNLKVMKVDDEKGIVVLNG